MRKGKHIINPKKQTKVNVTVPLYSIFDMSSCRKPEIQTDLPRIIKIKCYVNFLMF